MPSKTEIIGHSVQRRPLTVHFAGSPHAKSRVLVIAGQHGDERFARQAAERLIREFQSEEISVAALLDANPDGSHNKQRKNADGVDLNRDHQLLSAPETRAIHAFARHWRPHLIVDVHTYPPRRKHLLAQGLVHANDVFIDIANNPTACDQAAWAKPLCDALPHWKERVGKRGFRCDRYTLITKQGTVRHSTPDITDARNGLALSLGVPAVLLEGRERTRYDKRSAKRRTREALVAALDIIVRDATVRWPSKAVAGFQENTPTTLPIRSRYAESSQPRELDFLDASHQELRHIRLPGAYQSRLTTSQVAEVPIAYAVPKRFDKLLAVLSRHGIEPSQGRIDNVRPFQTEVRRVERSPHALRPPRRLRTQRRQIDLDLNSHEIISVTPANARLLTALLEPHSKYGLCRYPQLGIYPKVGAPYPVLRLEHRLTATQRGAREVGDRPAATV